MSLYYGAGINYKLFNEKLGLNLSAVNFHTDYLTVTNHVKVLAFEKTISSSYRFRGIQGSISWNFGKLSENVSKKTGVTHDDLLGK